MNSPRTFVGNSPYPARRDDWDGCARTAHQLLDRREQGDPAFVEKGTLSAEDAEQRLRVMRAITSLWDVVCGSTPLPVTTDAGATFGASIEEMHADLATASARQRAVVVAKPDQHEARHLADYIDALRWHLEPIAPGSMPHIWIAHDFACHERARSRQGRAA